MKELKVTKVKVELNGENIELNVKYNIPYAHRATCARVYAETIVKDDGTYEPWLRPIYQTFLLFTEYTDLNIPNDWGDDDLIEFRESDGFKRIWNAIDTEAFVNMLEMGEDLIQHRKATCRRNGFFEFLDNVKGLLETVVKAYQESPEAAEQLVIGLLSSILGNDDVESVEEEVFANAEDTEETEVEVNADV